MKHNVKTKAVTSRRIAWRLRKEGFKILSVEPDRSKPEFDVYIFKVVPGFHSGICRISKSSSDGSLNIKGQGK